MSTHADSKPWTVPALAEAKRNGQKLVMLTAYDAGFARTFDANGVDLILIGDSLGMVVQGHDSTLPVTVADMVYHTRAVARVLQRALLVVDLPFGADATPERALDASLQLLQAGAEMVKIEGAGFKVDIIRYLVEREIPVCAHLGLTRSRCCAWAASRSRAAAMPRASWWKMPGPWPLPAPASWCLSACRPRLPPR